MNIRRDEYGEERLLSVVAAAPPKADDIVSKALANVRSFVGKANQHNDITLVAIQAL
jgi:serine phosphatase RsbU (regulator of sigma subunit)